MKKLFLILAAILMASTGLWAQTQNVSYIDANGQTQSADATEVTNSTTTLEAGWYVVNGSDVQTGSLTCSGAVNLILADGAKLTAMGDDAGIQVSGEGNSLTIYGQTNQTGQLKAIGGDVAAGIGGNMESNGSNITINGGIITAIGYNGAGIGGGWYGSGKNIIINGGRVTAISSNTSGIGGNGGYNSNIKVANTLIVKAGATESATTEISNNGDDLAGSLEGKQYVTIEPAPVIISTTYLDADSVSHDVEAVVVKSSISPVTWGTAGTTSWYVVNDADVQLTKGAICSGNVNLILADGAKLTATGITDDQQNIYTAGIRISGENNTLAIYGQTEQTGQLKAIGGKFTAGIGGERLCVGSYITINGGTVTANGGDAGAGIGGGHQGNGTNITINGGTVMANGGYQSAGIGGGWDGNGTNITINGGTVKANGGDKAAGIGGGRDHSGTNITINGGTVKANGGDGATGIGGGLNASGSNIYMATSLFIKADNNNPPLSIITNTGSDLASSLTGKQFVTIDMAVLANYINENGEEQSTYAYKVTSSENVVALGAVNGAYWYIVNDINVTLSQGAICQGDVRLILADGAKLTATGITASTAIVDNNTPGIQVSDGNSLTIYGQTEQTGQLIANGGYSCAGIGGVNGASGSNITINGGTVTANGINGGAGIGGGRFGSGSNITINGGMVTANGGNNGAGIGGGEQGDGFYITINGGTVTATSNSNGSGIGGGLFAQGFDITINGGRVTATGGVQAAGIGDGRQRDGNTDLGFRIFVSTNLIVTADANHNPPITIIATYRTATTDIAGDLLDKRYVVIEPNLVPDAKAAAIAAINAAISETDPDDIKAIATNAVAAIDTATTVDEVNAIKVLALAAIATAKAAFAAGQAAGLGSLAEPCEECPAVEVKKGDKTVILYGPESVTFKKTE